jgi:hypothetical protein
MPPAAETAAALGQLVGSALLPEDVAAAELEDVPEDVGAPLDDVDGLDEPHAARTTPQRMERPTLTASRRRVDAFPDISPLSYRPPVSESVSRLLHGPSRCRSPATPRVDRPSARMIGVIARLGLIDQARQHSLTEADQ